MKSRCSITMPRSENREFIRVSHPSVPQNQTYTPKSVTLYLVGLEMRYLL